MSITYSDLARTIAEQAIRIAELEAELASLKDMHKAKWKDAYSRICPDITEEGEG